jgi:pantetheine-phosphate adenylyltransferase
MIRRAIYPGSFDPITNGHLDIIERSLSVFHELIILIATNVRKNPLLEIDERIKLVKQVTKKYKNVYVDTWDGLIMDYAKKNKVHAVIRGLRASSDFEYEFMMATMNKNINSEVETFFLMTGQNLFFISSTMIKELYRYGGDISSYVPKQVVDLLNKKKQKGKF